MIGTRTRGQRPAAACVAVLAALAVEARADGLKPGDVLNEKTWEQATGLLPPEILKHYEKGEYANSIAEWKDGAVRWGAEFAGATEENATRLEASPEGSVVDKATGERPPFVYGFPFQRIAAADPNAGVKVLWNYYYGYWSNGSRRNVSMLAWLDRSGPSRSAVMDVHFCQYDGQPADYRPKANPHDLLQQSLANAMEPADLQGTTALTWRYRAPDRRDSSWAYVPALRRVRQVSPSNRSDGFVGSDLSQDDGPFFDGKPEDFTWKLVGEREELRLADPYSLRGEYTYVPRPEGGWRVPFQPVAMAGFQDPAWKGVAWAPVNFVLVRRPVWVVEGVPHDRYYRFGKVELHIDRENFRGAWTRKFDWQGELINSYQIGGYLNGTPDGTHYIWGHGLYYQVAEDHKRGTATFAGVPPTTWKEPANDFFMPCNPSFYDYQTLVRFGK